MENRILELERKIHALEIDIRHANFNGELATQSVSIDKITEALPQAQAEFGEIIPDKESDRGEYAGLYPYIAATRPALNKHGLYFYHYTSLWKGDIILHARITHKTSGQWIESHVKVPEHKLVKDWSSDETKFKRYTARNILGVIEPVDDNDTGGGGYSPPKISAEQVAVLEKAINGKEQILRGIKETLRIDRLSNINQSNYKEVMTFISKELAKELQNNE